MRGARIGSHTDFRLNGIIPAYAGSTCTDEQMKLCYEDHPRVCGEHASMGLTLMIRWGSSPRMRGAPWPPCWAPTVTRIIPAYAGSTDQEVLTAFVEEDHPRVCGEHLW